MNSEFEMMLDDIVCVGSHSITFFVNGVDYKCSVKNDDGTLFAEYTGGSFTGALKKAWQELCG